LIAVPILFVLTFLLGRFAIRSLAREYRTFLSPSGDYRVVVYRIPMLFGFPGQSGDASGFVRLYDKSNHVLQQKDVDMVEVVDRVDWRGDHVEIELFADWLLPAP